jgi:hypothetical protein
MSTQRRKCDCESSDQPVPIRFAGVELVAMLDLSRLLRVDRDTLRRRIDRLRSLGMCECRARTKAAELIRKEQKGEWRR